MNNYKALICSNLFLTMIINNDNIEMLKRLVFNTVLAVFSLMIALVLAEVLLRMIGLNPWSYQTKDANEPTMHEPHPVLGWRNKRGDYTVSPYHSDSEAIYCTFLDNGLRSTAESSIHYTEGEIVIVGGSYTQGWALSDNETYAWKLHERYVFMKVLNYGTAGYGSYQSLLVLERELPCMASPKFVLYGFTDHHEVRNVATSQYLQGLLSYSKRSHVEAPFATIDKKNGFNRHPTTRFLLLPFSESFAVINLIGRAYGKCITIKREHSKNMRLVSQQILLEMNKVSEKYGATFFVVLLEISDWKKEHYIDFLNKNNIRFIDCSYHLSDEMRVPGEGHPNSKMNTLWARCIQATLDKEIDSFKAANKPKQLTH